MNSVKVIDLIVVIFWNNRGLVVNVFLVLIININEICVSYF